MTEDDISVVQKLAVELGYPDSVEAYLGRFRVIKDLPSHRLLVLENEGIQGWIHLERSFPFISSGRIIINAMVVTEKSRGLGFGKALLEAAKTWAKDSSVGTIYLSSNINRDKTHAFYLKNGFTKTKTSHFFELKI